MRAIANKREKNLGRIHRLKSRIWPHLAAGRLAAGVCDHLPICPQIDHTGGFGLRSCLTMVAWRLNRTPGGDTCSPRTCLAEFQRSLGIAIRA